MSNSTPKDIADAMLTYLSKQEGLKVMVFGPGKSGGKIYKKRCEIKEAINKIGHNAYFGEDICNPALLDKSGLNLSTLEFLAAKHHFDYIVCLMTSPGSIGEVHEMAQHSSIAHKMMICVDNDKKLGYAEAGVLKIFDAYHGKIDRFKYPEDIDKCNLSTRILKQIKILAAAKLNERAKGITS